MTLGRKNARRLAALHSRDHGWPGETVIVMSTLSRAAIAGAISSLRLLGTLTLALALAVLLGGTALAQFHSLPAAGFTRGSVSLTATPDDNNFLLPGAFAPGDHAVHGITVTNSGSLALRYAVTSISADDGLASWLDLTVWEEAAGGDTGDGCGQQPPGHTLYGPGAPGSPAGIRLIGDPAQGLQEGDRTLSAGASEKLCFLLAVPLSVGNTHQSSKASPTFRFDSEQVDGNP
jgi:spore coat-associated protein N